MAFLQLNKDRAREVIIAEWLEQPADKRETEHQASSFAMRSIERYKWISAADPYQEVMNWIFGHIRKS